MEVPFGGGSLVEGRRGTRLTARNRAEGIDIRNPSGLVIIETREGRGREGEKKKKKKNRETIDRPPPPRPPSSLSLSRVTWLLRISRFRCVIRRGSWSPHDCLSPFSFGGSASPALLYCS